MSAKKRQNYRHLPAFILLTLAQGETHGGAIFTTLSESLPDLLNDTGALYRSLQQLENDGSVSSAWDTTESGPARKIYRITQSGWNELTEWKKDIEARYAYLSYFLETFKKLKK